MKILVGIATFPTEPHVYETTIKSLDAALDGLPDEIECEVRLYDDVDMHLEPMDRLTAKHNLMKQQVLDEGFDALLTVEADIIIPPHAVQALVALNSDLAYGLYCSRKEGMWLCFPVIEGFKARSLVENKVRAKRLFGTIIDSQGVGFGCTLIRRNVLETVTFRREENNKFADDWHFALDVKAAGFVSKHHLGVVCGHVDRDGSTLWPDIDAPKLYRRDPSSSQVPSLATVIDNYIVLKPLLKGRTGDEYKFGDTITLDGRSAERLLNRRFIKRIGE